MSDLRTEIRPARVRWLSNGAPYSQDFNDIYFSPHEGIAESEYVYLTANQLPERWRGDQRAAFTIGELGFGSGLNFLLTMRSWRNHSSLSRLEYFAVEKHPLSRSDLEQALLLFPELASHTRQLLTLYPPLLSGYHRLDFGNGVCLNLLFGDAIDMLSALRHSDRQELSQHHKAIDAWFLDGFAPSLNADMWSDDLCYLLASLSVPGSSFASFTAAGHVRRTLQAQGFAVSKQAGFGAKREMLLGKFEGPRRTRKYRRNRWFPAASWYATPANTRLGQRPEKVAIIGAGLAGCSTAAALAARGVRAVVYDSHEELAAGASGNPGAALYSPLSEFSSPLANFSLQAYLYACHYYSTRLSTKPCGLVQLTDKLPKAIALAAHINDDRYVELLSADECAHQVGISLGRTALYFRHGRSIHMAELCEQLIQHELISLQPGRHISKVIATAQAWRLFDQELQTHSGEFDAVVICCGPHSRQFTQLQHLPTRVIRGQGSALPQTPTSKSLRTVLCDDSYLTPAIDGQHWLGSSYILDDHSGELRGEEHCSNALAASALINDPLFANQHAVDGWAALRCTSPDYLPIVGQAPKEPEFYSVFADLQHDKNKPLAIHAPYHQGLFVNTAYGSRGLCFAPLCAEQLASQICNELSPLPSGLRHALSPARFIVRNITRGHFAAR